MSDLTPSEKLKALNLIGVERILTAATILKQSLLRDDYAEALVAATDLANADAVIKGLQTILVQSMVAGVVGKEFDMYYREYLDMVESISGNPVVRMDEAYQLWLHDIEDE